MSTVPAQVPDGSLISSKGSVTAVLDPGELTVRDRRLVSECERGPDLELLETACRGKVVRLGDRAVAFPSDLQCRYVGVALEDVPAWRAGKLAARALDFDQQDEVQDNSPASEDETSSDDDSETEVVEFPRQRPAVEDPDLYRRIGTAKSVAALERRDDLSRPEQALLNALSDVLEDRRPPYVGVPLSVMNRLRERREGRQEERIGPATLSTYIAVSFFADYGGEDGARPTREELAEIAGCSKRRFRDHAKRGRGSLPVLEDMDLVERERRPGRRTRYRRAYDRQGTEARVPNWAIALLALHPDGDAVAVAVLTALLRYADYDHDGEITALPSDATVARHALCSRSTVLRRRKLLERLGIIVRDESRSEPQNLVYKTPRRPPERAVVSVLELVSNATPPERVTQVFGGTPGTSDTLTRAMMVKSPRTTLASSTSGSFPNKSQRTLAGARGRGRPRRTSSGGENGFGQGETEVDDLHSSADSKGADGAGRENKETSNVSTSTAESVQGREPDRRSAAAAEEESAPETWEELLEQLDDSPELPGRDDPVQVAETPDGVPIMAWTAETEDGLNIAVVGAGERTANPLPGYLNGLLPSIAFRDDFPTDAAEFFASLPATLGPHPATGRPVKLHVSRHGPYLIHTSHDGEEGYGTVDVPLHEARSFEGLRGLSIEDAVRIIEEDREKTRSKSEEVPDPVITDSSGPWSRLEPAT